MMIRVLLYFFLYSFIGWCVESILASFYRRKPVNKGILQGPFSPLMGVIATIGAYYLEPGSTPLLFAVFAFCVVSGVTEYVFCALTEHFLHLRLWDYSGVKWNVHGRTCFLSIVLRGVPSAFVIRFFHQYVSALAERIPDTVVFACVLILVLLLTLDVFLALTGVRSAVRAPISRGAHKVRWYHRHLMRHAEFTPAKSADKTVFAQGYNAYKLFWIFLICSLVGDLIEVIFIRATTGVFMSRSSLLYGPFSIVWGIGGALLTATLHSFAKKSDRYIFIGGALIGGVYEYVCSVFTEYAFGYVFWDYSHIPFNINGRVNLLFCGFWGVLALLWVKGVYPRLSHLIEMIPVRVGKVATVVLAVFLVLNVALSAGALMRMGQRAEGVPAANAVEELLDTAYPDEYLLNRYQNILER